MRTITKVFIILFIGVISLVLLNVLVNVNADTLFIQTDDNAGQSVSASPTLLAPVQEPDSGTVSNQNYNSVVYLIGLIGVIGIMVVGINYVKRNA